MAAKSSADGVCSSGIVREMPLSMSALAIPSGIRLAPGVLGAEGDQAWPPKPAASCQWWELPRAQAQAQCNPQCIYLQKYGKIED